MRTVIFLLCLARMPEPKQQAFIVWGDRDCPIEIKVLPEARIEAPLKDDGTPDLTRTKLVGVPVTFKPKCGRIEIRREK